MRELYIQNICSNQNDSNNDSYSRRNKLKLLRQQGFKFPNNFRRDIISSKLYLLYNGKSREELEILNIKVRLAGRMITRRIMGKASFVDIQDVGGKIQLYITHDKLTKDQYNEYLRIWDIGDILGIYGKLFKTHTNNLSINCDEIYLLTKSMRPLPDKFHGLMDQEIRYRKRYLDLIANEESRKIFKLRSFIVTEIRNFMIDHDFMEVETPMMQLVPGGALAKPFITHHNSLNTKMYLRISPELYLKRLVIGGFERVFEINRNFRNEGLSPRHNPEFTMMELYMAYADYHDLMLLIEKLLHNLTQRVLGNSILRYNNHLFDFSQPFTRMTLKEAICYYNPKICPEALDDIESAISIAKSLDIKIINHWGLGKIQTKIFENTTENYLIQPTFITAYPAEVSPLARCNDDNPFFADRFELFIGGREISNGFSELNDPEDQAIRFTEQAKIKNIDDDEAMFFDEDYITALEHGLPPTAGLGIGIDRLIMLFTNTYSIRDVILFPTLRPYK